VIHHAGLKVENEALAAYDFPEELVGKSHHQMFLNKIIKFKMKFA
jgi:hypothetical protein